MNHTSLFPERTVCLVRLSVFTVLLFLVSFSGNVRAQRTEDVIYLSNGSVIRGRILDDSTGTSLRILNHAGDIWAFTREEIDSITREKPFEYQAAIFNEQGPEFQMNGELLVRGSNNAVGKAIIPGLGISAGYRFNSRISLASEIGLQFYEYMEVPLSASCRFRFSARSLSPVIFFRTGYTIPAEKRPDDWEYEYKSLGGFHYSLGLGLERVISNNASFILAFSYNYQELRYRLNPLQQWLQERTRTETYSRLGISIGFIFR